MSKKPQRADFMTADQKFRMSVDNLPRTHENCIKATGVARPGKTAKDRWMRFHGPSPS